MINTSSILYSLLSLAVCLTVLQLIPLPSKRLGLLNQNFQRQASWGLLLGIAALGIALSAFLGSKILIIRAPSLQIFQGAPAWLSLFLDRLSCLMLAFISLVGALVYRYSIRYLDGEPRQDQFLAKLVSATLSAQLLAISGTFLVFGISWVLISLSLHALLEHYHSRPRAILAARKKFIISRIGDAFLISAALLIWSRFKTIDFATLFELIKTPLLPQDAFYLQIATLSILGAAMCKSAQVPFHSWLPDTLETPTPVSALMHAGIVNGGGYAIIRLSPLFNLTPHALTVAVLVGTVTSVFGLIVMWAQTNVKKRLAWSTVAQMGFMILECGLGAYGLALLHIIGHGIYKAHAFLNSGTVDNFIQPANQTSSPFVALIDLGVGACSALAVISLLGIMVGHSLSTWPGGILALLLFVLALSQLFVFQSSHSLRGYAHSLLVLVGIAVMAAALDSLAATWLHGSIPQSQFLETRGLFGVLTFGITLAGFVLTTILSILIMSEKHREKLEALFTHAINGFYFGLYADRMTRFLLPQHRHSRAELKSLVWENSYE